MAGKVAALKDGVVSFEYQSQKYEIDTDLDVDVLEYIENDQIVKAVKAMLGDDQYAKFKATKPKLSNLNELMEAAFAATRTSMGESSA